MLIDTDDLMSLKEAAVVSGYMTEKTLYGRVRRGDLKHVQIGTAIYVTRAALEDLLKREGVR
jgi:hypothetical protein